MVMVGYKEVPDLLRGGKGKVNLRFDRDRLTKLSCHCNYDPALRGKGKDGKNEVVIPRDVEVEHTDGSWGPYPSVTLLDEVNHEDELLTMVLLVLTGETALAIKSSTDGVLDAELMNAAEEAGILTDSIG